MAITSYNLTKQSKADLLGVIKGYANPRLVLLTSTGTDKTDPASGWVEAQDFALANRPALASADFSAVAYDAGTHGSTMTLPQADKIIGVVTNSFTPLAVAIVDGVSAFGASTKGIILDPESSYTTYNPTDEVKIKANSLSITVY